MTTRLASIFWRSFVGATIVFLFIGLSRSALAYDESKFCNAAAERVAIFVDVTTPFDERSKSLFEEGILKVLGKLSGGQSVDIFTIENTFAESRKLYEGCVPYCPEKGLVDWITSDCTSGLIRLRANEQKKKLGRALRERLSNSEELPFSEIVRTLNSDLGPITRDGRPVTVYIFSDMIENSEFIPGKVFHGKSTSELLELIASNDLLPNLKDCPVRVFGVGRGGNLGRKALPQPLLKHIVEFWRAYFKRAGATDVYIGESLSVN